MPTSVPNKGLTKSRDPRAIADSLSGSYPPRASVAQSKTPSTRKMTKLVEETMKACKAVKGFGCKVIDDQLEQVDGPLKALVTLCEANQCSEV